MLVSESKRHAAHVLWLGVRFLIFGVGGFSLMLLSWVRFLERMFVANFLGSNPLICLPLTVLGAVAMLFGVAEWGRWAYLFVFLSIPCSMFLYFLPPLEHSGKEMGVLIPATAVAIAYIAVRLYYSCRSAKRA
jgi:hypothetical protein